MTFKTCVGGALTAVVSLVLLWAPLVADADEVLASGTFQGTNGHITNGTVSVVKSRNGVVVVLGSDFSFDGAPDPKVGFGRNNQYDLSSQLAPLRKNTGKQSYAVPAGLDVSGYNEVYIWCEQFSVSLGVAKIR